ncbi:MAG: T9SS type A sorting domain-containing protein [Bacteroidetes bacterium]|nr:T9SS type A sorting domain-containing protein [Bacteroidota bacterium]
MAPFSNIFSQGTWTDVSWSGTDPIARTECTFVQSGNRFYLVGGRGINKQVMEFNYNTNVWTARAAMPANLHHFQAVELDGLIYVVGAFGGNFPNETPKSNIYIYDPVDDSWTTGPEIPLARQRGSGGTVVYNGKIYWTGGLTDGHNGGWVTWTDVFDPKTNTWAKLADAPRERDHFQAVLVGDKIYTAAGRRTGDGGSSFDSTIAEVDIYDIPTDTWSTLPASGNIPFECGGALAVNFNGAVVVMGGEQAGTSDALEKVQVLDVSTGTWYMANDMHRARHGSQAIVNNDRIYMAAGSRQQGGQLLLTSDSNFFIEGDFSGSAPSGTANSGSDLNSGNGSISFPVTVPGNTSSSSDKILANNGNQAIIITSLSISGSGSGQFSLAFPYTLPVILAPGDSMQIDVDFVPGSSGPHSATLQVQHTGDNATVQIPLSGTGGTPPAPVELLDFKVTEKEGNAILEWSTASELNNDYFSLEKSRDGLFYSSIGNVPGQGTSFVIQEYRFEDTNPFAGTSYYRLKQVDLDGSFEYSSIREFHFNQETVQVFPNPVNGSGELFLNINLERKNTVGVQMIDMTGRIVLNQHFEAHGGETTQQVSLNGLANGVYWMEVRTPSGRIMQKMILVQ